MTHSRPHDTPAGHNPDISDLQVEVLSDTWYTLRRATFRQRRPDGSWVQQRREAYDRGNGACALLHDPARDTVLLVRQYRLPVHLNEHPDGMLLEVPAGLLDEGEDPETALRRELEEETGHRVGALERRYRLYSSPGSVTEHVTYFAGTYSPDTQVADGGGRAEEGEQIDLVELTVTDAMAMIADGRIIDAKTVLLLQDLLLRRSSH